MCSIHSTETRIHEIRDEFEATHGCITFYDSESLVNVTFELVCKIHSATTLLRILKPPLQLKETSTVL